MKHTKPSLRHALAARQSIFLLCLFVTIFSFSAGAEENAAATKTETPQEPPPGLYQPSFCEFPVTFPEKPYSTRRCDSDDQNRCYDLVNFTKVFDQESTVNFRVICNPVEETVRKQYSGEVMQATLRAMTARSVVSTYETSFREEDQYKQAALVGEGQSGRLPTVFIAQLWIGQHSALSVEAEMIGEAHPDADKLLSDVLQSVRYAPQDKNAAPGEQKPQ